MQPNRIVVVGRVDPPDLPQLETLLADNGLPLAGLGEHSPLFVWTASAGGATVGCVALEVHGTEGLLRSLAVDGAWRGCGLGVALSRAVLDEARQLGLAAVWLLTETAGEFFPRLGFVPVDRREAPEALARSAEFAGACPASARCMRLSLPEPQPDGAEVLRFHDALMRLARSYQFRDRDAILCHGITVTQCHVLDAVARLAAPSVNSVAAHTRVDKSTASRAVEQLAALGLVERAADPSDGRAQRLAVTAKGGALAAQIHQELLERERNLLRSHPVMARRAAVELLERLAAPEPAGPATE